MVFMVYYFAHSTLETDVASLGKEFDNTAYNNFTHAPSPYAEYADKYAEYVK
jgi:hypothetical protein